MQLLIATGSLFLHLNVVTTPPPPNWEKRQTFWILMQKREKRTKNWIELLRFQFPLLASCCIPPIVFFSIFFFFFRWILWYFPPLPSPPLPLSLLSLTPRQFSPDRFHSVLEGMDLIALWGLVGCAGLGCLISVPCRDWFNASWSWNCLIVQPSGDSPCLRRPAGLAKHCSRLLLYAAGGRVCLKNWNLVKVEGGSTCMTNQGTCMGSGQSSGFSWVPDCRRSVRPPRNVYPYNISSQLDAIWKWSYWLLMQYQYLDCDTVFLYDKQAYDFQPQPSKIICCECGSLLGPHIFYISAWKSEWMPCIFERAPLAACFRWLVLNVGECGLRWGHRDHFAWIFEWCAWSPWVMGAGEITFV